MENETLGQSVIWGACFVFALLSIFFMALSTKRLREARKRSVEHNARIEGLQAEANQLLRDILAQLRARN